MIKKANYFLTNYKVDRKRLDSKLNLKKTFTTTLGALFLNLLVFLIPGLLIYNLFIIDSLRVILTILIFLTMIAFSFLYNIFYIKIAKANDETLKSFNFKTMVIVESTIFSVILIIFTIIVFYIVR